MFKNSHTVFSAMLWTLASASEDQNNITAEFVQNVTLTCQAPNNDMIGVMWRRADLGGKYVYLNREGQPQPQEQHPSFKNRVDLKDTQMKDGDVSLILKNVTLNNTGTYECRVFIDETHPWKSISIIYLSVIDPPDTPGGLFQDRSVGVEVGLIILVIMIVGVIIFVVCFEINGKRQKAEKCLDLKAKYKCLIGALEKGEAAVPTFHTSQFGN
uniref:uncharacterized protein LOC112432335 isoform X1 n=1 Tax=Maylandia zebra TaxID=106582 RepID=UPI000D3142FD|nr:uncharacterized protein LOC112432335 isoform X1 [Maylandia zebra]